MARLVHFDLEMCFAPQRRALFRHLSFQKCSEREDGVQLFISHLARWLRTRTLSKVGKTLGFCSSFNYNHRTALHYTATTTATTTATLHYTTLHGLHYTTLHSTTPLHPTALHYILLTLRYTNYNYNYNLQLQLPPHYITLHYTTLH